jgi:hypothetical protein
MNRGCNGEVSFSELQARHWRKFSPVFPRPAASDPVPGSLLAGLCVLIVGPAMRYSLTIPRGAELELMNIQG